ncbi:MULTISPECIES: tetratricopeptide repeat protein [Mesobacillus]|nr:MULTISPECIES: tetratricopeptide repeat protein [Mesobacillus]MDQ0414152.1 tetratricopeptide (TPR) repeat protein [Mesobacillus stamsii]
MKKQDSNKDNLILFPGLGMRLLEKGLEYLKQQKYRDALQYLEQALEFEPENSDLYVGLVLAHYETGNLKQAKEIAAEMLKSGRGDYGKVIEIYLMILVQLNEYQEVVTTIEGLLEEQEIPREKHEHFMKMLEFGRKMNNGAEKQEGTERDDEQPEELEFDLFVLADINKQALALGNLTNVNIRPYIKGLKKYAESEEGNPFIKTMLVNILREQEYSEEMAVSKFGWKESFTPALLPDVKEYMEASGVLPLLADVIENDDPVLNEQVQSLVERYFFLLYPFKTPVGSPNDWAGAIHFIANEYYGFDNPLGEFADLYSSHHEEAAKVLRFIRELEEISYPII